MPIYEFLLKYSFNFVLVLDLVFEAFKFFNVEPQDFIIMYGHGHFLISQVLFSEVCNIS